MSFNPYHRCDTSDFNSIIVDYCAIATRSMSLWARRMASSNRDSPDTVRALAGIEKTATGGHDIAADADDDTGAWEAWCLGVAFDEIVQVFPPAPADPDDDIEDHDEDEAGSVLRFLEAA